MYENPCENKTQDYFYQEKPAQDLTTPVATTAKAT